MRTDYTAIALIVDRSGSMHSVASDTKGSVQQFIADQKKNDGDAAFTLVQFDDKYDVVHDFVEIETVDERKFAKEYSPRGTTALLDAIGRTTLAMSQKLDKMDETERPERVVVAVITDGYENASREYSISSVREMIKDKEANGWDFMFLGATLDTMDIAHDYGFDRSKAAQYDAKNVAKCVQTIGGQVTNARAGCKVGITEACRQALGRLAR